MGWRSAVGPAPPWRADATRSTPEACGLAPLPGNARRWLRAKLAVGISRPGAGRRVAVAKVGARPASLWAPRTPSVRVPVRASDLVPEPVRLAPGTRSPSTQPSARGLADRVLRPVRPQTIVCPQAFHRRAPLALGHAPRAGLATRERACQEGSTPRRHVSTPRKPWATPMSSEQLSLGSAGLATPGCKAGRR